MCGCVCGCGRRGSVQPSIDGFGGSFVQMISKRSRGASLDWRPSAETSSYNGWARSVKNRSDRAQSVRQRNGVKGAAVVRLWATVYGQQEQKPGTMMQGQLGSAGPRLKNLGVSVHPQAPGRQLSITTEC
jgi:hypothetical protein